MSACAVADTVFTFPTDGEPATWTLPATLRAELVALFPELDADFEIREAYAWVLVRPTRRKKARGMKRYLMDWFRRDARKLHGEQMTRRRAAHAPSKGNWREECEGLKHDPPCEWPTRHDLRCVIALAGCPHPGVCQTFAECQAKKGTDASP